MKAGLSAALALLLAACVPRQVLLPALGLEGPELHEFPADFSPPLSVETDRPMPGFGGSGGGLHHTPVIFIHGNTESARYWLPARRALLAQGWSGDELWAFGYGWNSAHWFDSNDLSAASIERMVSAVTDYLSRRNGREVLQVDIVAHSLGVTAARQWMRQNNAWHRVRNFVAIAGANHGTWTARLDAHGQNRVASLELAPGSPWLGELNRDGESPGAVRTLTLYDGSGWGDVLFPAPLQDSPGLAGARNLAWAREHGTRLDHRELGQASQTLDAVAAFLRAAPEPLPQARAPVIVRQGERLRASTGLLHCRADGAYPDARTPAQGEVTLAPGTLQTCYAHDDQTGLSSPMQRHLASAPPHGEPLRLSVSLPAGRYAEPQAVTLQASEADALIVGTLTGAEPDSGSPRVLGALPIIAPVTLRAVAIAGDGRRSEELRLRYDISLEALEQTHSLQSQLESDLPAPAAPARRRKGH